VTPATNYDLKGRIDAYHRRIALAERLVPHLDEWKRELNILEEAYLILELDKADPVDLSHILDGLHETGFNTTGLAGVLALPLPKPASAPALPSAAPVPPPQTTDQAPSSRRIGRPPSGEPTLTDLIVEIVKEAQAPLELYAIMDRLRSSGHDRSQEGVRSTINKELLLPDSRLFRDDFKNSRHNKYGLSIWRQQPPPPKFGNEPRQETIQAFCERVLTEAGAPLSMPELHRRYLQGGHSKTYMVFQASVRSAVRRSNHKAMLVLFKGRPTMVGLASWKAQDQQARVLADNNGHRPPEPEDLPPDLESNPQARAAHAALWKANVIMHWSDIASKAEGKFSAGTIKAVLYSQRWRHVFEKIPSMDGFFGLKVWPTEAQRAYN